MELFDSSRRAIETIIDFAEIRHEKSRYGFLVRQVAQSFVEMPRVISASVFIFNQDNLEFEFTAGLPESSEFEKVFDELQDKGFVSQTLQSGNISKGSFGEDDKSAAVVPLRSSKGLIGVVVAQLDASAESVEIDFFKHLIILANLAASSISEFLLIDENKSVQSALDQIVASRTLELEKSSRALGEKIDTLTTNLILTLPHEVRTPINQILGFTKFLRDYYITEETNNYEDISEILADITDSTERLKRLFENYLFYANLVVITNDIKQLREIRKQIAPSPASIIFERAMAKSIDVDRKNDLVVNTVDCPVSIDETYLVKLVDEIIDNCLKYSEKGTKIEISSHMEDEFYRLKFKDFGIGMPQGRIESLGAYVQFDRNKTEQQGMGLGLAIVVKILAVHRGDFSVDSKQGEYTEFTISLPVANNCEY